MEQQLRRSREMERQYWSQEKEAMFRTRFDAKSSSGVTAWHLSLQDAFSNATTTQSLPHYNTTCRTARFKMSRSCTYTSAIIRPHQVISGSSPKGTERPM